MTARLKQETFQLFIVTTDQDRRESYRRNYLEKIQQQLMASWLEVENITQVGPSLQQMQSQPECHLFYLLFLKPEGALALLRWDRLQQVQKFSPLYFDFTLYWKKEIPFRHTPFSKALGVTGNFRPLVVDGTCGTAKDSFLMMSFGCQVWAWEKSPLLALLLEDAYLRAMQNPFLSSALPRLFHLAQGDFRQGLRQRQEQDIEAIPDTIYLDPMFQEAAFRSGKRQGAPRKEMQIFHEILESEDKSIEELLTFSLQKARHRVVVKRPLKSPLLKGYPPFHSYCGKAIRYDLYKP